MSARRRLAPLTDLLWASDEERLVLPLSFIEDLAGESLPESAHRHAAWWSNSTGHARAWLDAGYRASRADVGPGEVAFIRDTDGEGSVKGGGRRGRPRVYGPLRDYLAAQDHQVVELTFTQIEEILGRPLPQSAYVHAAFWSNSAAIAYGWRDPGFRVSRAGVGKHTVRFVRDVEQGLDAGRLDRSSPTVSTKDLLAGLDDSGQPLREPRPQGQRALADGGREPDQPADEPHPASTTTHVVLAGCVASKRPSPAPAKELYTSALFAGRRRWAEASGARWFVLSAEHGIVDPDTVIEPYDRYLAGEPADYRRRWGQEVVAQLREQFGELTGITVEIHAGAAYVTPIRDLLTAAGAKVDHPVAGRRFGEQLAFYAEPSSPATSRTDPRSPSTSTSQKPSSTIGASFRPMPDEVRREVVAALLDYLEQIEASDPALAPDPAADRFLRDDGFAFLVGVILDQGIVAERAWSGPWLLRQRLGHWDLSRLAEDRNAVQQAVAAPPALHRMVERMPAAISDAAEIVLTHYGGDATRIWNDQPTVVDLVDRLRGFSWVGQKKAAMTVEILARRFGVPLTGFEASDIAYDVHVRRVFLRAGLASRDDVDHMVAVARELHQKRPGALDVPAWFIGRRWCRPTGPDCHACPIGQVCPQLTARGDAIAGM